MHRVRTPRQCIRAISSESKVLNNTYLCRSVLHVRAQQLCVKLGPNLLESVLHSPPEYGVDTACATKDCSLARVNCNCSRAKHITESLSLPSTLRASMHSPSCIAMLAKMLTLRQLISANTQYNITVLVFDTAQHSQLYSIVTGL
jgi:hypothetical protein